MQSFYIGVYETLFASSFISQITTDILAITPKLQSIQQEGSLLLLTFNPELTDSEYTDVFNIINDLSESERRKNQHDNQLILNLINNSTTTTSYFTMGALVYGLTHHSVVNKIIAYGHMTPMSVSYDIRLVNITTNSIITEKNFTNLDEELLFFDIYDVIVNPWDILELQGKVSGSTGAKFFLRNVILLTRNS